MPDATPPAGQQVPPDAWPAFLARLKGFVGARVDPAARDDVIADILLRLVRHQEALTSAENPMAWVTRVAGNAVVDHARRRAAEDRATRAYAQEALVNPAADTANDPSPASEMAACLEPFIQALPEPYRVALELVDLQGLTQRQATERLGLSLSGLKSRVQRGRTKLKQALLRCCSFEFDRRGGMIGYRSNAKPPRPTCCA